MQFIYFSICCLFLINKLHLVSFMSIKTVKDCPFSEQRNFNCSYFYNTLALAITERVPFMKSQK